MPDHILVFFHNLRGYNCYYLTHELRKYTDKDISCIAATNERYVLALLRHLRFVDSFHSLNRSLETLIENLFKGGSRFPVLRLPLDHHVDLLVRKNVYPHEYVESFVRFGETSLPSSEHYVNKTDSIITEVDCRYGHKLWMAFDMRIW